MVHPLESAVFLLYFLAGCTASGPSPSPVGPTGVGDGACGEVPWGGLSGTIHVDGTAHVGGDGSRERPFQAVGEAVAAAGEDDVVAVAAGTYPASIQRVEGALTVVGACTEGVILDGSAPPAAAVVRAVGRGAAVALSGLTVRGGAGVSVESGHLALEGVRVTESLDTGVRVRAGVLGFAELSIDGVGMFEEGWGAAALRAEGGAIVTGSGLHISASEGGVVFLDDGTVGRLADVTLQHVGSSVNAAGLDVGSGARVEVQGVEIREAHGCGASARMGGTLLAQDLVVADTHEAGHMHEADQLHATGAFGLCAFEDSVLEVTDATVSGSGGAGVLIGTDPRYTDLAGLPEARLTRVRVEDVVLHPSLRGAYGVLVEKGALEAREVEVVGVDGPGLVAMPMSESLPAALLCTDCTVREVSLAGVLAIGRAAGTTVGFDGGSISDVGIDEGAGLSVGILATHDDGVPRVEVDGATVTGAHHAALAVVGDVDVLVERSTLEGGSGVQLASGSRFHGNVVYASEGTLPGDGATGLHLADNVLVAGAGDTVLLHGASTGLAGNDWQGEPSVLRRQACDGAVPIEGADEAPEFLDCPDTDVLVVEIDHVPVDRVPVEL